MELKKIFLIITLTLLLVGIVNATEVPDNTNTDEKIEITTPQEIEKTNVNTVNNKQINKKNITKNNAKTATKTYNVKNYNELHSALTTKDYTSVTLNIKSDITLNGNTTLNNAIKTLEINGNNKTINGNNKYQFLNINGNNTISIKNLIFKNHNRVIDSSISNSKLTINSCTFTNNHARWDGGAISGHEVILSNCLFTKNTAGIVIEDDSFYASGGAIETLYLDATNCVFIDNHSNYDGGAIHFIKGQINHCNFVNDTTALFGGAIKCEYYQDKCSIINSNFTNNQAAHGGAIEGVDNLNIKGCIFNNNSARGDAGSAIYYESVSNLNINDNIFINNFVINKKSTNVYTIDSILNLYDAIYIENEEKGEYERYVNNNVFFSNLPKTKLSLTLSKPYEGLIEARGKLSTNDGKALADKTITINVDGKVVKVKTKSDGTYNYSRTTTDLSSDTLDRGHYLIVLYDGNGNYNPSAAIQSFNVTKIKTNLSIIKITQKTPRANMTVTGRFTSFSGKRLIYTQLKLNVNGKNVTVKTDKNGLFKYTFKPNTTSYNKITVSYVANSKYAYAKAKITKTFNQTTKLTLKKVVNKNKITYTGTFYSVTGKKLINSKLKIVINGSVKIIKTDNKGVYKYTLNNPGKKLKVHVYYDANSKYAYAPTSVTKSL